MIGPLSERPGRNPLLILFGTFVAWKTLIFLIALSSPGVGYDTSTDLLLHEADADAFSSINTGPHRVRSSVFKLVRWDAIYYTHLAERGHVFEQEWAFGIGLSSAISVLARRSKLTHDHGWSCVVYSGILISHAAHWLSAVLLWCLVYRMVNRTGRARQQLATTAAVLHIISPAGVFLSAPQSESLFSFLNMLGFLLYTVGSQQSVQGQSVLGGVKTVAAGAVFGCATVVRSNGILSGLLFLWEACTAVPLILADGFSWARLLRLTSVVFGGLLVGAGMLFPQYLAYRDFCFGRPPKTRRPWCNRTIPAIYSWVQSHYWNVGLFRYWTLSNLPLFLLAAPTLGLLVYSAVDALRKSPQAYNSAIIYLALPQLVLAVMALTSYHVQIITRLCSGYPLWYMWLAERLHDRPSDKMGPAIVRWMVLYGLIQACLYASFLPPA